MDDDRPFVVTLAFDPALQDRLQRDRGQYFPEHRNIVPAHVSLFHHLTADARTLVWSTLEKVCASTAPFAVQVSGILPLGRGTAYRMEADGRLHARLAAAFRPLLGRQDSQAWRPHVTLQNKVEPQEARDLQRRLGAAFVPFGGSAMAVRVWRYAGGPWEDAATFPLSAAAPAR